MNEDHPGIVAGDDYLAADGRSLTWYCPEAPDLAGATLELVIGFHNPDIHVALPISWTGTMPTGAPTHVAHLDVTHEQTRAVPAGCYDYSLRATLTDSSVVTIAEGQLTVQAEPGTTQLIPIV